MRTPLCLPPSPKKPGQPLGLEAYASGDRTNRLIIVDKSTGAKFLVDSGAEISVLPKTTNEKTLPACELKLYAANKTTINTYGQKQVTLNLGLPRPLKWKFTIADVPHAIIGADFLVSNKFIIDLGAQCLIDKTTSKIVRGAIVMMRPIVFSLNHSDDSTRFRNILEKYPEVTGLTKPRTNTTSMVKHFIPTQGPPVSARSRRLPVEKYKATKLEIEFLLQQGIIRPSQGPWASPIHHVKKKNGQWRMVGDYVKLNAITKNDSYALPHCHDFLNILNNKEVFSTLDLERAYQQISMAPEDITKTTIITPFGSFEYMRMPYGLKASAQTFQRYIDEALRGLPFTKSYIDDIIIASRNEEEHLTHLDTVLSRLKQYGLVLNVSKCAFMQSKVEYLGYEINKDGVKPLNRKVKEILNFPLPKTVCQLQKFLGMVNFYRRSIPHAAEIQLPLYKYINKTRKKDQTPISWDQETTLAYNNCKAAVANAILLAYPIPGAKLRLVTDASSKAIGATFEQYNPGGFWQPLGMYSQKLSPAQIKYSTYDRELLAIYKAVKYFRQLLEGCDFEVQTDHKPIVYAFNKKSNTASPRQARYLDYISQFTTAVVHISGKENSVADFLSRIETIEIPAEFDYKEFSRIQHADEELKLLQASQDTSCLFEIVKMGEARTPIICETSTGRMRPYVPEIFRKKIFDSIHRLSHPGGKATLALIKQRYMWPSMRKQILLWSRSCLDCQSAKISRHVKNIPANFQVPESRFDHVHMDLVGPLFPCKGYKYILTVIDRFSRWPEAYPIIDITADTVAECFYTNWICRFGTPKIITTDQGSQFESAILNALCKLLGVQRKRTTAYHPASNGMIERWHRSLKASLMCIGSKKDWLDLLPTVLLGLRSCVKEKWNVSPAELLYGKPLRLPGEFFSYGDFNSNRQIFMEKFREFMRDMQPVPVNHHNKTKPFCFKELRYCTHVFLRCNAAKTLEKPYIGPFKVLERIDDRVFSINYHGKPYRVNVERLKPAHLMRDTSTDSTKPNDDSNNSNSTTLKFSSQNKTASASCPSAVSGQMHEHQPSVARTIPPVSPTLIELEHSYAAKYKPVSPTGILKTPLRVYPPAKKKVRIADEAQTKIFFNSTKLYDEIN